MADRKATIRKRIIKAMPRSMLDEQFHADHRPWNADRPNIEAQVLATWDDDMRDNFLDWLRKHS